MHKAPGWTLSTAFFFKDVFVLFYVHECFGYMYVCTVCVPGTCEDQKASELLETELCIVVNYHVASRN